MVPADTLGPAFVGSLPSVVYHNSAPSVMSPTVNWAALLPITSGLPTMNWNCAVAMALFGRPGCRPTALMVRSGETDATVRPVTLNKPSSYPTGAEADAAVGLGTLAVTNVFAYS